MSGNNGSELCSLVIKSYYNVYNTLGYGFIKEVYVNALAVELDKLKLVYEKQRPITVFYNNVNVGEFSVDLLIEGEILVEIKVADELDNEDEQQLFNHLKATGTEIGLLLNFGKKPEFKRKLYI